MKLTFKLIFWFLLSVVVVLSVNAYLGVRAEVGLYESELAQHHSVMGQVLRPAFNDVLRGEGEARALAMLDYTDKKIRPVDIRWVALNGASGANVPQAPYDVLQPLLAGEEVHYFDRNRDRLFSYAALRRDGSTLTALEFAESYEGAGTVLGRAILRQVAAVLAIALSAGAAAAVFGALLIGRPVQRLVEHARRVGKGDLSATTPVTADHELGDLAREMNLMSKQLAEAQTTRLRALEELRHSERLNTVGKLASGLAHELGTPLNVVILRAKAIATGRAVGDRAAESARSIAEQATRMTDLVRELLDFARRRVPQRTAVHMEAVVARTAAFLSTVSARARVKIEARRSARSDLVVGDAGQLQQVVTNLLMNAVQAMPEGGVVQVDLDDVRAKPPADRASDEGDFLRMQFRDEGSGIPEEILPRVFEPFFTTKDVGEGTGLGLSVCYGILRDHNGWIEVESVPGAGSTFSVFLPHGEA